MSSVTSRILEWAVGVLTIWCPYGRVSLTMQRLSEQHLAFVGIVSFAFVLAGLVSGVLYALGLLP